ncbi:MAG: acetyl-CoA carboxylase biotin carboxyl carrier protein, partial [Legionella sp.]|nr:acetyl-CoA carboxylase biotin carboxyl carrier protein [Legionella sp.]
VNKDTTIRIQKSPAAAVGAPAFAPVAQPAAAPLIAAVPAPAAAAANPVPSAPDAARARWKELRSPIVGTFYGAASPTSPAFVNVGDRVKRGQPLCIIEAMKVMNEIESELDGTIREILVENGSPVEAEAVLFLVDPD